MHELTLYDILELLPVIDLANPSLSAIQFNHHENDIILYGWVDKPDGTRVMIGECDGQIFEIINFDKLSLKIPEFSHTPEIELTFSSDGLSSDFREKIDAHASKLVEKIIDKEK